MNHGWEKIGKQLFWESRFGSRFGTTSIQDAIEIHSKINREKMMPTGFKHKAQIDPQTHLTLIPKLVPVFLWK